MSAGLGNCHSFKNWDDVIIVSRGVNSEKNSEVSAGPVAEFFPQWEKSRALSLLSEWVAEAWARRRRRGHGGGPCLMVLIRKAIDGHFYSIS